VKGNGKGRLEIKRFGDIDGTIQYSGGHVEQQIGSLRGRERLEL